MQIPLQIAFRDMESSEYLEARIREKVDWLEKYSDRIIGCRVMVEAPHRHQNKGRQYHVRIDLTVPGSELVISRDSPMTSRREDVYLAVKEAFEEARRQLQDWQRRIRRDIKYHAVPLHGTVTKLLPIEGYGFIETPDGQEVYFHRNSVVNDHFDELDIGAEVRYVYYEGEGEKGEQASTVYPIGKQHPVGGRTP